MQQRNNENKVSTTPALHVLRVLLTGHVLPSDFATIWCVCTFLSFQIEMLIYSLSVLFDYSWLVFRVLIADLKLGCSCWLMTEGRTVFSYILEGSWDCWSAPSRSHQIFLWKETSVGSQVPAGITIQEHSEAWHLLRAFSQDVWCFLVWVIGYWSLSGIFSLSQFIWWVSSFPR